MGLPARVFKLPLGKASRGLHRQERDNMHYS